MESHPLSKGIQNNYKASAPFRLWRCFEEKFYTCNPSLALDLIEQQVGFDLEEYKDVVRLNNDARLPNGYYFVNHLTRRGGFLHTDDYGEAIDALKAKGLIYA